MTPSTTTADYCGTSRLLGGDHGNATLTREGFRAANFRTRPAAYPRDQDEVDALRAGLHDDLVAATEIVVGQRL